MNIDACTGLVDTLALYEATLESLERILFGDVANRSRDELEERAEALVKLAPSLETCECGCLMAEHDQYGCTLHRECEVQGAWYFGGVDPYYACGAAYCDDIACVTHNINHPNHES